MFLEGSLVGRFHTSNLFYSLFLDFLSKNDMVADILSQSSSGLEWNLLFTRDLYEWKVDSIGTLTEHLKDAYISYDDSVARVWSPTSDGLFSSKSFFKIISSVTLSQTSFPYHNIWNSLAPPCVKAFSWVASW